MNYNSEKIGEKRRDTLEFSGRGMSGASGSYNAVSWLLDRNVDEGRGGKLAFTDTVSELTYGALQQHSRRVANMLRRLGVRREERVAMIMLDTVDFPMVFLGAIRAGVVPVPLNTLLTSDQYAYVLADCRARVLFVSEALLPVVQGHGRADAGSRACRCLRPRRPRPQETRRRGRARKRFICDGGDPCRRAGLLAVFVGLDRHAQGRAASACKPRRHRRDLRQTGARHSRGRCRTVGGETVFRLWPRQCADLPDVGRRHHGSQPRAPDAGDHVRADEQLQSQHLLRRADAVFGDAER